VELGVSVTKGAVGLTSSLGAGVGPGVGILDGENVSVELVGTSVASTKIDGAEVGIGDG